MKTRSIILFAALLLPTISFAEISEFGLLAGRQDRKVQFLLASDEPALGCNFTLYGSRRRSRIETDPTRGKLITSYDGTESSLLITAPEVRALKIGSETGASPLYFIATKTCGAAIVRSNIERVRLPLRRMGLTPRNWLNHLEEKLTASELTLTNAFPAISFTHPIDFQQPGDGSDHVFVAEQGGIISVVRPVNGSLTKSTFLDITDKTEDSSEQGLLGLAFHPNYASNGFFFVNYTDNSGDTVIARYHATSADDADESSEAVVLTVEQPASNHNGGGLSFGPDGFLYIALGDGGADSSRGQDKTTLLGKILRINVDSTELGHYGIPATNPFVGDGAGVREEIFAYGFRNPWRINWDLRRNNLWVGDVGQGSIEEVDLAQSGGNYGWDTKEGSLCYNPPDACDESGLIEPLAEYDHGLGSAITGGYVYRGSDLPALRGHYLTADFGSGRLWALPANGSSNALIELQETGRNVSSFGQDRFGELYLLSYGAGTVLKITG